MAGGRIVTFEIYRLSHSGAAATVKLDVLNSIFVLRGKLGFMAVLPQDNIVD